MNIKEYLVQKNVPFDALPHEWTSSAARLAHSLHEPGRRVAKTVLLRVNHGYRDVVAVLPADCRVDPQKASKLLGGAEVKFGTEENVAVHCPDCERGVLPPFGSEYGMRTIVDESLARNEEILFEGNAHDEAIRLKWRDYSAIENPLVGPFAVPIQPATAK